MYAIVCPTPAASGGRGATRATAPAPQRRQRDGAEGLGRPLASRAQFPSGSIWFRLAVPS